MEIQLKGHVNRRKRILPLWLKMKEYYDAGKPVNWIVAKVKQPNGKPYSRSYFYKIMKKLEAL